ncbi:MAG: 16S rRNA (uracil(1498)-N(3))-methyltransferase [Acidobacteriia bacterium]|nr:16S rRNA (uracil(1498)-N(3))-methyltransferase [Terriglobia bacterium]
MSRRRWIADEVSGDRAFLLDRNAEHLARALRVRVGQEFEVSTGDAVRLGRVVRVADDRVEFELGGRVAQKDPAHITLLLAIFKFDRMEWAIEKATELGASEIVPVIARRTDAHLAAAAGKRVERWRRIAHEAAQQSRRVSPPEIVAPRALKSALAVESELRILLSESECGIALKQAIDGNWRLEFGNSLALAVGPEGGWTADEIADVTAAGWTSASLGNTILRAETAAIAALAIAISELQ